MGDIMLCKVFTALKNNYSGLNCTLEPGLENHNIMKYFLTPAILVTMLFSCSFNLLKEDNFEFGIKYNAERLRIGSPLINQNMHAQHCCGVWTVYEIDSIPEGNKAYHYSKTIRGIINGKLSEEKDIYRKGVNDTTILQLNILTLWPAEGSKSGFEVNIGKVDVRSLNLKAADYVKENSKYPGYNFTSLNLDQLDSVLNSWKLSISDK